ncbi:MAG: dirigent protein [Hyphomicrobiales bacterium]|nr:dirigent protein [Hyphomicrobiales bacterium]
MSHGLMSAVAGFALAGAGALSVVEAATPAEGPPCGKFTIIKDPGQIEHFDAGQDGAGPGDTRSGHYRVLNQDNEQIGDLYFSSSIVPGIDANQYTLIGSFQAVFANGAIHWNALYPLPDPTHPSPAVDDLLHPVAGGTGDFAGARGTFRTFVDGEGRRAGEYDISCQ